MDKCIVYSRGNGTVCVILPAPNARRLIVESDATCRRESEDELIARLWSTDVPADAVGPAVVQISTLPQDRTYREAWQHNGGGIVSVEMVKAREVEQQRIRRARAPILAMLDVEVTRALGCRDFAQAEAVEARRQALRDAPADPRLAAAETPEELKQVWSSTALGKAGNV